MNMKTVICLLVTIFTSAILYSQDVIVTKEGEEIEVKISQSIEYVQEVLVYDEDGQIIAEVFLNESDYPDARDRIMDDMKEVNKAMASFKRVNKTIVRDEEFPKTTTLKIVRKYMEGKVSVADPSAHSDK